MEIAVNGRSLSVVLEDNSSAAAHAATRARVYSMTTTGR